MRRLLRPLILLLAATGAPSALASPGAALPCPFPPLTDRCPVWTDLYDHPGGHANGMGTDVALSAAMAPDDSRVFVAGYSNDDDEDFDAVIIALDPVAGSRLWTHRYAGTDGEFDGALEVRPSVDGRRVYVAGTQDSAGPGTGDYLILALDAATGERLWATRYDNGMTDFGLDLAVGTSHQDDQRVGADRLYVTGQSEGTHYDGATVAVDGLTGETLWTHRYGEAMGFLPYDAMYAVAVDPSGERVVVVGDTFNEQTSTFDSVAIALDSGTRADAVAGHGGEELWRSRRANSSAYAIAFAPGGERLYWAGFSRRTGDEVRWGLPSTDYLTVSLDPATGAETWARTFGGYGANGGENFVTDLAVAPDGEHVYVTGVATGVVEGDDDFGTVAYRAADGTEVWTSRYGATGYIGDAPLGLGVSPDGNRVYVTGVSGPGLVRTWLVSNQFTFFGLGGEAQQAEAATVSIDATNGRRLWTARLNGSPDGEEGTYGADVAVGTGRVFVTGWTRRPVDRTDPNPGAGPSNRYDLLTAAYTA